MKITFNFLTEQISIPTLHHLQMKLLASMIQHLLSDKKKERKKQNQTKKLNLLQT